ncbi:MAG TPA: SH3 domain-containing protein [Gemmatimonadales bacterium]|nr:SH3 domain-containing protein [Gemmatimonadales bacterium]
MRAATAQQPATVRRDGTPFLGEPGGRPLGRLTAGVALVPQGSRGASVQVTVDGWIIGSAVASANRDGHGLALSRDEYLRTVPNGRLVARLVKGALVDSVEQRNGWIHVRRAGWVASRALAGLAAGASFATAAAAPADTSGSLDTVDVRSAVLQRPVRLYHAPDSLAAGLLEAGVPVRVTARAGDWVRVEAAGWVRAGELRQAGGQTVSSVTAADLRSAPEEWRGRVIRWTIQFIALQTADELRPDFAPGQQYILARGPAPEYAFVYVVVPPDKVAEIARLQPLDSVTIVARVKSGRSTYLANPILELVDVVP